MIPTDVVKAASDLGCEGQEWVKLGELLLYLPYRSVLDLFSDTDKLQTNSQKAKVILIKWKDKKGTEAKAGQLRQAYVKLNKGGAFDERLEMNPETIVTESMIEQILPISCGNRDWLALGRCLLSLSDDEVRDLFPLPTDSRKNSERVDIILTKWQEKDGQFVS